MNLQGIILSALIFLITLIFFFLKRTLINAFVLTSRTEALFNIAIRLLIIIAVVILGASILMGCQPELIKPGKSPEIAISSPVSFIGSSAWLYDTLKGPKGTKYNLTVKYVSHGHALAFNPTISFDGSGTGSASNDLPKDLKLTLWYEPTTEGNHPIFLFWKNQTCGFYPDNVVAIQLYVKFEETKTVSFSERIQKVSSARE